MTTINQLTKRPYPAWTSRMNLPARQNRVVSASQVVTITINDAPPPEQHPDYFPVLKALSEKTHGRIVSITSHKPGCDEWHEVYTIELGHYWYERRTVFALVRIG